MKGLGKAFLKRRETLGGAKAAARKATKGRPEYKFSGTDIYKKEWKKIDDPRIALMGGVRSSLQTTKEQAKKVGKKVGKGAIIAGLGYAAGKSKAKKEANAKETKAHKDELKKSIEEHKKKTKEKRIKYGKYQD